MVKASYASMSPDPQIAVSPFKHCVNGIVGQAVLCRVSMYVGVLYVQQSLVGTGPNGAIA
jgi:hypothetical protein